MYHHSFLFFSSQTMFPKKDLNYINKIRIVYNVTSILSYHINILIYHINILSYDILQMLKI